MWITIIGAQIRFFHPLIRFVHHKNIRPQNTRKYSKNVAINYGLKIPSFYIALSKKSLPGPFPARNKPLSKMRLS